MIKKLVHFKAKPAKPIIKQSMNETHDIPERFYSHYVDIYVPFMPFKCVECKR